MLTYIITGYSGVLRLPFLVGFVIPVFRATRQIRGQVKQENARQQQSYYQQENNMYSNTGSQQQQPANAPTGKSGDYIDFEEIK